MKAARVVEYARGTSGRLWWCNSHQREATHVRQMADKIEHCCDPSLGGILLPCMCVDLTDDVEPWSEGLL